MQRSVEYRQEGDTRVLSFDGRALSSTRDGGTATIASARVEDLRERALAQDRQLRASGWAPNRPWQTLFERLPAIGCDLDGTFFLRGEGPEARNWFDWHRVEEDGVNEMVAYFLDLVNHDGLYSVVLLSGRPEDPCGEPTERALKKAEVGYAALHMRPPLDNRPDDVVKEEMFRAHVEPYWDMRLMLDDRNRVVDMWRDRVGLFPCWQVARGDF